MSRASGVSKEDAGRFRRLIMHFSSHGPGTPGVVLFVFSYWLNGRKAAATFDAHVEMFRQKITDPEGRARLKSSLEGDYPELARYMYGDIDVREISALERKAAGMFCDGLLSRPEYPTLEGMVYMRTLTRGVYTVSAVERLAALAQKGKLSAGGFRPVVTMDDMPDYTTVKAWDGLALARMNAIAAIAAAEDVAELAYDHDYERACTPNLGKPVRTADVVRLTLDMAEQGMKDIVRVYRDWLEDLDAAKFETEHDLAIEFATRSQSCSPYFTPVDGGDPVQAYDDYLKRRRGGQA